MKNCFANYVGSSRYAVERERMLRRKSVWFFKFIKLQVCNTLLVLIEQEFPVTGLAADSSTGEFPMQLSKLFHSGDVHAMLEKDDHHSIDMFFPFICAFVDKATPDRENGDMTDCSSLYFNLVVLIGQKHWSG